MFGILTNVVNSSGADPAAKFSTIGNFGAVIVNLMLGVSVSIAIVCIGYSFLMFIWGGGDPKAVTKAWNAFLWGIIAAAISIGTILFKNSTVMLYGIVDTNITNGPTF